MLPFRCALRAAFRAPLPLALAPPRTPAQPPLRRGAGREVREFSSFRESMLSLTGSVVNPVIASVFNAIRRNEALELRMQKFSKHFPDWEGAAAFVEGCGCALQALMDMTNNRCTPHAAVPRPSAH